MIAETIPEIGKLSPEDQIELANELWERNGLDQPSEEWNSVVLEFLKRSHARYLKNPDDVITHDELREKYKDLLG